MSCDQVGDDALGSVDLDGSVWDVDQGSWPDGGAAAGACA